MRPLVTAGCAVVLLGLCGVAGASATKRPDSGARDRSSSFELVLEHGHVRAQGLGEPGASTATAAPPVTPTTAAAPAIGAAAPRRLTFPQALLALEARGEITSATESGDRAAWITARESYKALSGSRKAELGDVLNILQRIARTGQLTPARLPELVLTLDNNRTWWTTGPLLAADQRVGFPGSHLVWEFYPGQGLQIQWLGTFGAANGFWDEKDATDLAALTNEALGLAVTRGGGIAWEYDFAFDGGEPPWVSAITQGTAVEAITHAATMLHSTVYLTDAHDALGIFQTPAPVGIESPTAAGARYLIYSFAPHDYVINAFIQSLIGLFTLGAQGDTVAQTLFQRGNAQAQLDLPSYNTGYWSLYDQYGESDLSYHELLTGFLHTLCGLTKETSAAALAVLGPQASGSTGASGTSGATPLTGGTPAGGASGASGASGGTGQTGETGATGSTATAAPNPNEIYCTTASAFSADLAQPPTITITPQATVAVAHRRTSVRFTLSKISNVTFAVQFAGTTVSATTRLLGHGSHSLAWRAPHAGTWTIVLTAVDLAGNRSQVSASVPIGTG